MKTLMIKKWIHQMFIWVLRTLHPKMKHVKYNGGMFDETDENKLLIVIRGLIDQNDLRLFKKLVRIISL